MTVLELCHWCINKSTYDGLQLSEQIHLSEILNAFVAYGCMNNRGASVLCSLPVFEFNNIGSVECLGYFS